MLLIWKHVENVLIIGAELGILIAIVLLLRHLLRNYTKKYVYFLWGLIVLRGALPFVVAVSPGLVSKTREEIISEASTRIYLPEAVKWVISGIYIAGVLGMLVFYLVQYIRARMHVKRAFKGYGKTWLCKEIEAPFVMGIFPPKIYLPDNLKEEECAFVVAHEKNHMKHGDPWLRILAIFGLCIHWWNPLMWYGIHKMNEDLELFCDEKAVENVSKEEKQAYANVLLSFAKKKNGFREELAFGESVTEKRVQHIFMEVKKNTLVFLCILVLLFFGIILSFVRYSNYLSRISLTEENVLALSEAAEESYRNRLENYDMEIEGTWNLSHVSAEGQDGFLAHFVFETEWFVEYPVFRVELNPAMNKYGMQFEIDYGGEWKDTEFKRHLVSSREVDWNQNGIPDEVRVFCEYQGYGSSPGHIYGLNLEVSLDGELNGECLGFVELTEYSQKYDMANLEVTIRRETKEMDYEDGFFALVEASQGEYRWLSSFTIQFEENELLIEEGVCFVGTGEIIASFPFYYYSGTSVNNGCVWMKELFFKEESDSYFADREDLAEVVIAAEGIRLEEHTGEEREVMVFAYEYGDNLWEILQE